MNTSPYKETIIISMGGSLLVPDAIDTDFLARMKDMLAYFVDDGYQIIIVVGGGKTSRNYQAAAQKFDNTNDEDLDWLGIKTIHLNCELVRRILSDMDVHDETILDPKKIQGVESSLVVVGAWKPGHSSDTDAVEIAHVLGGNRIINFSNTAFVYDGDPRENPDAQKFTELSWEAYRNIIPNSWSPGLSAPFDPVASEHCQRLGLTVAVLGASLENLEAYLRGEDFEGTIIS
jgi:uridylate kinase